MTPADVEKQRERLVGLLKTLFQLDQPALDFGFYRIMHAKSGQVSKFLEEDLLSIIRDEFGVDNKADIDEALKALDAARRQAAEYELKGDAIESAPPVKRAKAAYDAERSSGINEAAVYDHLYRFFKRYYDNGDFMSLRYSVRETEGKAAP